MLSAIVKCSLCDGGSGIDGVEVTFMMIVCMVLVLMVGKWW